MKKLLAFIVLVILLASCSRSVTPADAANRNFKRCHNIR